MNKARRSRYEETRRGNVDYRIQGIFHSTVQKEDSNRKEIVKRLSQQFENLPICDSLIEDLNKKIEEFNPFSVKSKESKELSTSIGNTEYFELSEISSKQQWPYCTIVLCIGKLASYIAFAASACSRRIGIDS